MNSLKILGTIILVLSATMFAVGQNQPPPTTGTLPMYDRLEFPEVEGWKLGERTELPGGDEGIFLNYDSPAGEHVTIYVYRRGDDLPADKLSGVIKDELDGARDAIKTVADAGLYTELKQSKSETASLGTTGKIKALRVQMTFKARGAALKSEIYVFPYKGHVAKIRASRPAAVASNEAYDRLLAAIDQFFSK